MTLPAEAVGCSDRKCPTRCIHPDLLEAKGWLSVDRSGRYLAGVELQEQGGVWSDVRYWADVSLVVAIFLAALREFRF
jgi:hypothetical protein